MDTIHYLVHLGYDKGIFIGFEKNLYTRIDQIGDRVSNGLKDVLIFVDQPCLLTENERKFRTFISLVNSISFFIAVQHTFSTIPSLSNWAVLVLEKETPKCIIDELYEIMGDDVNKLRMIPPLYKNILDKSIFEITKEEDIEVKAQCKEYDEIFRKVMGKDFLSILKKLWIKYKDENPYNISLQRKDVIQNMQRYLNIKNYAQDVLGKNRVYMCEFGEDEMYQEKYKQEDNDDQCIYEIPKINMWENIYGDATSIVERITKFHTNMSINNKIQNILNIMQEMNINANNCMHIVGGEYFDRCVSNFALCLVKILKFNSEMVMVDKEICLEINN